MGFNVSPVERFHIPDVLRNWPWQRSLNPHYLECKAESASWLEGFNALSPKAQAAFNRCDFSKSLFLSLRLYLTLRILYFLRPPGIIGISATEQGFVSTPHFDLSV